MQVHTGGRDLVKVDGRNVRQVILALDRAHPGMRDALLEGEQLRPDVAVMLNGEIARLGLLAPVGPEVEMVFIPAISGG